MLWTEGELNSRCWMVSRHARPLALGPVLGDSGNIITFFIKTKKLPEGSSEVLSAMSLRPTYHLIIGYQIIAHLSMGNVDKFLTESVGGG